MPRGIFPVAILFPINALAIAIMPRNKALIHATAILACLSLAGCGVAGKDAEAGPAPRYVIASGSAVGGDRLRAALEPLFDNAMMGETRAVLIMHGGEVVAEVYGADFGPHSKLPGWSMSKTVTAILAGMMIADGRLALDRPAPVPAWSTPGDPRGDISLRQLLMMTSGLDNHETAPDDNEDASYKSDAQRMLFLDGAADMARYAENRPLEAAPGEVFEYSTVTTTIICDVMTRALTQSDNPAIRRDAMMSFARGRLFEPLGMHSMTPEFDARGTMIGGMMIHATAMDWARLGEFLRHNGAVRNAQIMPTSWPRLMKRANEKEPSFGMHLWLNRWPRRGESPLFPDRAPSSTFASLGENGQFLIVVPDRKLTVVRLGHSPDAQSRRAVADQLSRIIGLF